MAIDVPAAASPLICFNFHSFQNSVGFSRHLSLLMSIFLQLWFLLASTLTWWLIERVGRRRLFMLSACCMGMVMAVVAAMLAVNTRTSGIVAVVMIFAYQAFFTWGFMGGVWVSYTRIPTFLLIPYPLYRVLEIMINALISVQFRSMVQKFYLSNIGPKEWVLPPPLFGYFLL